MKQTAILLVSMLALAAAAPASAANKEHQQLMADLRILQEQTQLLQNALGTLTDALKAVNTRIDQQTETNRKAFADQKLVIDNLTNDVRVIREKLDDNNVRIGSLSQEVDALRQQLQQAPAPRPTPTTEPAPPPGGGSAAAPPPAPPAPGIGLPPAATVASPQKLWDAAYSDYTSGNYDLAVIGFESYIKTFPKSDMAANAQVYICASYLNAKKDDKAVEACDVAIRQYPNASGIPEAFYRKGVALRDVRDLSNARSTWEELVRRYPDSTAAQLAKQELEKMKRPD